MRRYVSDFKAEWAKFFSNIVLGFNDALIELTGALVGFSFALRDPQLIVVAGLVTGLSAIMSMAASAYQQARYEKGRNPVKAALFTGISYLVIAFLLVLPFIVFEKNTVALCVMGVIAFLMIAGISFYSALLLKRSYIAQLGETCLFSLGVAVVTFLLGQMLSSMISA